MPDLRKLHKSIYTGERCESGVYRCRQRVSRSYVETILRTRRYVTTTFLDIAEICICAKAPILRFPKLFRASSNYHFPSTWLPFKTNAIPGDRSRCSVDFRKMITTVSVGLPKKKPIVLTFPTILLRRVSPSPSIFWFCYFLFFLSFIFFYSYHKVRTMYESKFPAGKWKTTRSSFFFPLSLSRQKSRLKNSLGRERKTKLSFDAIFEYNACDTFSRPRGRFSQTIVSCFRALFRNKKKRTKKSHLPRWQKSQHRFRYFLQKLRETRR